MSQLSNVFDRMLGARAPPARRGTRTGDVPDRTGCGRPRGTARAGVAPVRAGGRSRNSDRCGAARAGGPCRRHRRARRRPGASRPGIAAGKSPPTRRRCRSPTLRSISWCRRWRCNSSTICRAPWSRSAASSSLTACCSRRSLGGDSLSELREAFAAAETEIEGGVSPRIAPFAGLRDLGALLQRAGFALPVTDIERVTVRYDSPFALMHDLRRMGATNTLIERRRTPLKRAHPQAHGRDLRRTVLRSGRPLARELRDRVAFRLGAARKPAAAARAGLGAHPPRRRARHDRNFERGKG